MRGHLRQVVTFSGSTVCHLYLQVLGIGDRDLAQSILEIGKSSKNPHEFAVAIRRDMSM